MLSRCAALAAFCLSALVAQGNVQVTVDFSSVRGQAKQSTYGLNVWAGLDPAVSERQPYRANLDTLGSPFLRLHAAQMVDPASGRGWVDASGAWLPTKIDRVLDAVSAPGRELMINIPRWPAHMDADGDDRLDAHRYGDYASWCADLVRVTKQAGHSVRYWEPVNEWDGRYAASPGTIATIYNLAAAEMKKVDPTIQVGGGAWTQPYDRTGINAFLDGAGANLDFFSHHHYPGGNGTLADATDAEVYDRAPSLASQATVLRGRLDGRGLQDVPIFVDEWNAFWTWENDQTRGFMRGGKGAVFDALVYKNVIESGSVAALHAWNERDGIYGKTGSDDSIRPAGHLMALANDLLVGDWVQASTGDATKVQVLAVVGEGGKQTLMIINRSGAQQTVDLAFAGKLLGNGYTLHRIDGSGLLSTSLAGSARPTSLTLGADSVMLVTFPVPEPATAVLAMLAGVVLLVVRVRGDGG